ncbi:MAG: C45 family peptidase [Lutimonas sp.]
MPNNQKIQPYRFKVFLLALILMQSMSSFKNEIPEDTFRPDRNSADELPLKRNLNELTFSGSGYELGFEHGSTLKDQIAEMVKKWKANTTENLKRDADEVLKEFMAYGQFTAAIKQWTPELYDEIKGISDGSGQDLEHIMVLNLLDEFWVYLDDPQNHHCSDMGVPARNGNPTFVAQNMDIEGYTDGFQTVVRLERTSDRPEQLLLTHPGLIVLNGMNEAGVGVVVNTIMQLKASATGLPVAFVIRKILSLTNKTDILDFIQTVPHASGQNYIIGIGPEVFDFEASAGKVVRYDPENANGTVYHTNHPVVNDHVKQWYEAYHPQTIDGGLAAMSNSYIRFNSLVKGIKTAEDIKAETLMKVLRSKDDPNNPVCRNWNEKRGFTFASTIMTLGEDPFLLVTAGPPDESEYLQINFSRAKK